MSRLAVFGRIFLLFLHYYLVCLELLEPFLPRLLEGHNALFTGLYKGQLAFTWLIERLAWDCLHFVLVVGSALPLSEDVVSDGHGESCSRIPSGG